MSFYPIILVSALICSAAASFSGDLTFYYPDGGIVACGTSHSSSEFIAALSFHEFVNTPNPNNSPSCQQCALIRDSSGNSAKVRIRDKCAGCQSGDIDVTPAVFQIFAPLSVGRTPVTWDFVPCDGSGSGSGSTPTNQPSANYCGSTYTDALSCSQACPGGLDGECPPGQTCFAQVPCSTNRQSANQNYCGSTYNDALSCSQACPGGLDGECPPGQTCFADVPCSGNPPPPGAPPPGPAPTTQNYCGSTYTDALSCSQACPGGLDGECPPGQTCFAQVPCSTNRQSANQNYCGSTYNDALSCSQACPGGLDGECPPGQTCFADVPCSGNPPPPGAPPPGPAPTTQNYCGSTYTDALSCSQACPGGLDGECPPGQTCFAQVPCSTNRQWTDHRYCGSTYSDALSCSQACPGGLDGECPPGQRCFANVPCSGTPPPGGAGPAPTIYNYCGSTYTDALSCSQACPGGADGECPPGQTCFADVPC